MRCVLLFCLMLGLFPAITEADYVLPKLNERVDKAFQAVAAYNDHQGIKPLFLTQCEVNDNAVIFTNQMPLKTPVESMMDPDKKKQSFAVSTIFLRKSSTIEKRMHIALGPEETARMRFVLKQPFKQWQFTQYAVQEKEQGWQIYENPTDIFFYTQTQTPDDEIQVKEWIYAQKPHSRRGSEYHWKISSEEFDRFIEFELQPDGSVALQRHVMVKYVKAGDYKEHKRIVKVVRQAMKDVPLYIHGEDKVGRVLPATYLTREGIQKKGFFKVSDGKNLTLLVREPESAYPLVIDPTVSFR